MPEPTPHRKDAALVGQSISRLLGLFLITQAELAEAIGLSQQTLSAVVRGTVDPRASTYDMIFGWFGLDRAIEDFEAALPEIIEMFPEIEAKAAAIRARRPGRGTESGRATG